MIFVMFYSLLGLARQMFNPIPSKISRSGSTGPASTSLEFTRTLVSSLTAPFRHLLVRTSYRIIRDIGMMKIDSKLTSKLTSKLKNHRHLMIRDMMMG